MKVAISASGTDLSAQVDPRFGRCQYIIVVDTESLQFEAIDNTNTMAGGGAGVATAQMVADKDVQAVLTGNCGPNAHRVLSAAGIAVATGVSGTIRDAIDGYKAGRYQATCDPTVEAHFGMGTGAGMGRAAGRWTGTGIGMAMPHEPVSTEQELQDLKTKAQTLAQDLSDVQRRIENLEKGNR